MIKYLSFPVKRPTSLELSGVAVCSGPLCIIGAARWQSEVIWRCANWPGRTVSHGSPPPAAAAAAAAAAVVGNFRSRLRAIFGRMTRLRWPPANSSSRQQQRRRRRRRRRVRPVTDSRHRQPSRLRPTIERGTLRDETAPADALAQCLSSAGPSNAHHSAPTRKLMATSAGLRR